MLLNTIILNLIVYMHRTKLTCYLIVYGSCSSDKSSFINIQPERDERLSHISVS